MTKHRESDMMTADIVRCHGCKLQEKQIYSVGRHIEHTMVTTRSMFPINVSLDSYCQMLKSYLILQWCESADGFSWLR